MNKNVQDKLVDEIRGVISAKNAYIEFEDLNQLPYLDQVLNETLRLLPTVPFLSRRTTGEVALDEYTLPEG